MAASYSAESMSDTEIIFTAGPDLSQQQNRVADLTENKLPGHVQSLQKKLKHQQKHKETLADYQARLRQLEQLIGQTESLNSESVKFNTQSAVLLTALSRLETELGQYHGEEQQLLDDFLDLKQHALALTRDLTEAEKTSANFNQISEANHKLAGNLIKQLQGLIKDSETNRHHNSAAADQLQTAMDFNEAQQNQLSETISEFCSIKEKTQQFFEDAEQSKLAAEHSADELQQVVASSQLQEKQLEELCQSVGSVKQKLVIERQQQLELIQQTRNLNEATKKQNHQNTTLIERGQLGYENLKKELDSSLRLNKKFQSRLIHAEEKFREATQQHEKYLAQTENALRALKKNDELLDTAAQSLSAANEQKENFSKSLDQFQHSNEQSQHLVLRMQSTLDSLFSRNQLLERGNKLLAERVNAMASTGQAEKLHGIHAIDDLPLNDSLSNADFSISSKSGFYKLMMLLAILLPLSLIAHSVISAAGASPAAPVTTQATAKSMLPFLAADLAVTP